jgi:hypothetical protein
MMCEYEYPTAPPWCEYSRTDRYSFIDGLSQMAMSFAKKRMFKGSQPMPAGALVTRYAMFLTVFVIRTTVKITLPEVRP